LSKIRLLEARNGELEASVLELRQQLIVKSQSEAQLEARIDELLRSASQTSTDHAVDLSDHQPEISTSEGSGQDDASPDVVDEVISGGDQNQAENSEIAVEV